MLNIAEYKYIPILSLQPAEMAALEELPEKDKDLIFPLIPLKGWVSSKKLESSIDRVAKSIGKRFCAVDIDSDYLSYHKDEITGEYPSRDVFSQLDALQEPNNGYQNWVDFIAQNELFIPVLQLGDLSELSRQVDNFFALKRFFIVRVCLEKGRRITSEDLGYIVKVLLEKEVEETLFIFDCGDVSRKELLERHKYAELVKRIHARFPLATFSVSGTSFPYSFAGSYRGELPIYERQIFDHVEKESPNVKMMYSDRGSTRAGKTGGGNGSVPVRLDYPLKHDWRFIRKESVEDEEKEALYQEAALEMMSSDYWKQAVRVWGTQMIERTSLKDPYAITSPNRATAARINIHLFQQLHYKEELEDIDTEEEWVD